MTFVKKGVVIPIGGAGEIDGGRIYELTDVLINDKVYLYYTAYDGTTYRIALAISDDGFNFVKKGVVIPLGGAGEIDDGRTYEPTAVLINDKVYLYYGAYDGTRYRIALAISDDRFNFVKKGVVIPIGGAGEIDDEHIRGSTAVLINDKVYLYYNAYDGTGYRIALAISDDGFNFVKKGVVIPIGGAGEIDDGLIRGSDTVLINDKVYLYYNAYDGTRFRIALAISDDGFNFVKKGIVINIGGAGEIDDWSMYGPTAVLINDKVYLYYNAYDGSVFRIALAISDDGF